METQLAERQHQKELVQDEQFVAAFKMNHAKVLMDDGLWTESTRPNILRPVYDYCESIAKTGYLAQNTENFSEARFQSLRLRNVVDGALGFRATANHQKTWLGFIDRMDNQTNVEERSKRERQADDDMLSEFRWRNHDKIERNEKVDVFRMYLRNGHFLSCIARLDGAHDREQLDLRKSKAYCRSIEKQAINALSSGNLDEASRQITRVERLVGETFHPSFYATPDVPKSATQQRVAGLPTILRLDPMARKVAIQKWTRALELEESTDKMLKN